MSTLGGSGAGVLTTEAGLTFTGDSRGNMLPLRTSDGKNLWHAGLGQKHAHVAHHLRTRRSPVCPLCRRRRNVAWSLPE